ncbi:UDP-N-acetylmuramate dehydrogenase [Candidatus Litorirhabdus singularis]|uniref:UDP-N-acetylmuramate dehydrogenase n=1 Tax=Candidatus Litorirhabdus singularis TaxID=2518993 RepID=UPI002430D479|nr:UDP-N-acetylmuramate dehydrogenase [Candidatus Litorirhabdus singularis]
MQANIDLQAFNTLATPSRAQWYAPLREAKDFAAAWQFARQHQEPLLVLGGGSNVVLGERLPGLVLHQLCQGREILLEDESSVTVAVAGGENWHQFVHWSISQGWAGLENLALIPGSVGAAPIQNIGAYGAEVGGFIERVLARDLNTGEGLQLSRDECAFGYRDSVFKRDLSDQLLIETVVFKLPRQAEPDVSYPALAAYCAEHGLVSPTPLDVFNAVLAIRTSKLPDPARVPNVGSFFKNPQLTEAELEALLIKFPQLPHYARAAGASVPAAWLIEACGFKTLQSEPVRVHGRHALVVINPDKQSATTVRRFAARIQSAVAERFGILLEQEPRNYG